MLTCFLLFLQSSSSRTFGNYLELIFRQRVVLFIPQGHVENEVKNRVAGLREGQ